MSTKLWQKTNTTEQADNTWVDTFTAGRDRELDVYLAPFDVLGSMAHAQMLSHINLLTYDEYHSLWHELRKIYDDVQKDHFAITDGVEDIHSQVEIWLTDRLGETGKKIHSGRSRNDQVLVDLKMYLRHEIEQLVVAITQLVETLTHRANETRSQLMPGYTHMQVAMPSSFGLWFGSYAEALSDDLLSLQAAYRLSNQNPLGSAAGYGSSFSLDREMTTRILGFEGLHYNVVYTQMARSKTELCLAQAISATSATLAKLSMDVCLYMGQNYRLFSLPDSLTTGSSIMPHKKNPDVFELIRARANALQTLPQQLSQISTNLPTGYHRDLQQTKEILLPAIGSFVSCIQTTNQMMTHLQTHPHAIDSPTYDYLFTVEEVNKRVIGGMPFRDAYREVGTQVENKTYTPDRSIKHTHVGSIGEPATDQVLARYRERVEAFGFDKVERAYSELLSKPFFNK